MEDDDVPVAPDQASHKNRSLVAAAICLAASLGFVALGGGALVGVFLAMTEGQVASVKPFHLDTFLMVLYAVAAGCFAVAAVVLFVGLRRLLRA
jgi:hypothetical protein